LILARIALPTERLGGAGIRDFAVLTAEQSDLARTLNGLAAGMYVELAEDVAYM
jgi:hypothetical protein